MGVVYAPVLGKLYYGGNGFNGFVQTRNSVTELAVSAGFDIKKTGCRVIASRSHLNDETKEFMNRLTKPIVVKMGSSLKFMLLAEGKADIYPRYAPTMEWDTAAGHAILLAAGGKVLRFDNHQPLTYGKSGYENPFFLALAPGVDLHPAGEGA